MFGSDLTSVPLIGYAFASPTMEFLGSVLDKESEDVETPFLEEQGMDASMRPGFSLLLKMD